ncbi:MAG TPA: hypothetical protein VKT82_13670 [Ktedonobacterales bacterium]|nr:hypothetical protein [Ktedonobacterales bacterium]
MAKQKKPGLPTEGTSAADASSEQPLNVVLSLTPEPSAPEELPPLPVPPPLPAEAAPAASVLLQPDAVQPLGADQEIAPTLPTDGLLPTLPLPSLPEEFDQPAFGTEAQRALAPRPARRIDRLGRWFAPPALWWLTLGLALLFFALIFSAWSTSAAGVIFPDWGLAALRLGFVAAALGAVALVVFLFAWQARARPLPVAGGVLGLVLVFIGAGGILGAAPLYRLQALWYEGRGQYGLALAAYQASGDSLAQSQDLARISVEWAEQLSAGHDYGAAVAQLAPVARLYKRDAGLVARAEADLIQNYLAWGDQARQQGAFSAALAHYQALQQAAYCDASCQAQAHERMALALLGLAQQLTSSKQYDQAVATYQQIVQQYSDTPEVEQANQALTMPQPLTGKLIYANKTPAKRFEVLLASRWSFNAKTQVFTLLGQQYRAQTDASGLFTVPAVAVGQTYMIAWVDTSGHAGTCYTTNNQPLYQVEMRPLRAADAGSIDVECV